MRIFAFTLLVLVAGLQYLVWFGKNGELDLARIEQDIEIQQTKNAGLKQRNDEMFAEIDDLRQGLDAIEERARHQLGMVKPDETFYRIVGEPSSGK